MVTSRANFIHLLIVIIVSYRFGINQVSDYSQKVRQKSKMYRYSISIAIEMWVTDLWWLEQGKLDLFKTFRHSRVPIHLKSPVDIILRWHLSQCFRLYLRARDKLWAVPPKCYKDISKNFGKIKLSKLHDYFPIVLFCPLFHFYVHINYVFYLMCILTNWSL